MIAYNSILDLSLRKKYVNGNIKLNDIAHHTHTCLVQHWKDVHASVNECVYAGASSV